MALQGRIDVTRRIARGLRKILVWRKNLEARAGIEPAHKGFADLSLTTWVPRLGRAAFCRTYCPTTLASPASAGEQLERETRFELATLALARRCSTTELLPLSRKFEYTVRPKRGQTAFNSSIWPRIYALFRRFFPKPYRALRRLPSLSLRAQSGHRAYRESGWQSPPLRDCG